MGNLGQPDSTEGEVLAIDVDETTMQKLELAQVLLSEEAGRAVSTEETVLQALRVLVEAEQNAALARQHEPRPRR